MRQGNFIPTARGRALGWLLNSNRCIVLAECRGWPADCLSQVSPDRVAIRRRDIHLQQLEGTMADEKKPANSPKQGDKNKVADLPAKGAQKAEEVKGGRMPERLKRH